MKTTLEQLEINGEVLDMTEYTTKEEMQSVAKESTLLQESAAIKDKIDNIDLSSIEEKIDNIDLSPIETKVDEGVVTLSTKIDNIDLSSVAKQGENPEATMSSVLKRIDNLYTYFDEMYAGQLKAIIGE